jgi:hypothetical protein
MARINTTSGKLILLIAALATIVTLFAYAAVQQVLRQSANDPQIQLAEDGAYALSNGVAAATIASSPQVDAARSLAPFVMVIAPNGSVEASSGNIGGKVMTPPAGSLAYARHHHEDRITWQPKGNVRLAAVVVWNSGPHPGYVVAARNLREVEIREGRIGQLASITIGAIVALSAIIAVI